jgi:type I site-specific restriction endonuclease
MPPVNYQDATEQQTRGRLIDRDLARAGWTAKFSDRDEQFP